MDYLKYKTIANTSPQGKSKVYFCCHEDDFDTYFESVCNEIFTCNDCSIWYCQNNEVDIAEYEDILKHMQLFIMPVSLAKTSCPKDKSPL